MPIAALFKNSNLDLFADLHLAKLKLKFYVSIAFSQANIVITIQIFSVFNKRTKENTLDDHV